MKNLIQLLYIGLLLGGTLAVPVEAQTLEPESASDLETSSVPDSETGSVTTLALELANESEVRSSTQTSNQPTASTPSSKAGSVAALASQTANEPDLGVSVQTPSESGTPVTPLDQETDVVILPEAAAEDLMSPVSVLSQAVPTDSANEQESLKSDNQEQEEVEADPMGQVTNVTQLSDVQAGDWAFEALRSLVEHYGCIAGYPDGTFRGNRAMSRYEFAAGLNACLQQVERLIAGIEPGASREDLETLQRLATEFQAELTSLGTRVDNLEGRTAFLEGNQFSTTTKLYGQVVVGVQGRTENEFDFFLDRLEDPDTNINVISNVQLSLYTQFSPRSLLLTGLQAGSGSTVSNGPSLTNFVRLGYEGDTNNDVVLSDLTYRQLIGNNFAFIVGPAGVNPVNVFRGTNRVESAGFGPLSLFAQRNPIINVGNGRGGIGFDWQISPRISLQGVYSASRPEDPDEGGLFGGDSGQTSAGAQLVVSPTDTIDISLQYVNAYSPFGDLGTGVGDSLLAINNPATGRAPIQTNAFGTTVQWQVTPRFTLGGWFGYTNSELLGQSGNVETVNWMAFLNFPDLFGEGNLGGIYVGQPPKITSSDLPSGRNIPDFVNRGDFLAGEGGQPGTATHVEAFYRFRVSNNISVTPGFIVVFNPGHNPDNDTITIGSIRTTLTF